MYSRLLLVLVFAGFLVSSIRSGMAAEALEAGIAVVDITPPVPYRMSGYFSERASTGVHDQLMAKAIVFRQGDEQAALVFCDLIGIAPGVTAKVRELASKQTQIPTSNIAIAATHSHTGPLYFGALREHFHRRSKEKLGSDPYERVDYPGDLVQNIVKSIDQAQQALRPVRLAAGIGSESRLSFNRRFHMKDGGVRFNPGQQNPNIVRTAGPIDPDIGLIAIRDNAGQKTLGAIVAFALHLDTVGGTEYSADYPKYLQDELRQEYGGQFVSLFGAGTCGDLNHIDVSIRGRRSAKEIGTMLAGSTKDAIKKLAPIAEPDFAVRSDRVEVPLQRYSTEEIADAAENMNRVDSGKLSFLERVKAYKIAALQLRGGETMAIEVQVFRLSDDVAIVTLPGEVFVELGLAIKQASPFKTTLVVELTNDAPGYIPTRKAFAEGSYETVNSRVATGGGEEMVKLALRLLKELRAEQKEPNANKR